MASKNKNMHKAKAVKNDEFYTMFNDIAKELNHYKDHFKGKTVLLNCDDPEESKFYEYFTLKFDDLGLKKVIATHYKADGTPSYKIEFESTSKQSTVANVVKTPLVGNGDFRNQECIELLNEADVVVTNPPFSLFREYIDQLMKYDKEFLVIGSKNAITYKNIFNFIAENKMWLGTTMPQKFLTPSGNVKAAPALWFTNLEHRKRNCKIDLVLPYNKEDYPFYDDYEGKIIEVSKVVHIPKDWDGLMGVPITFLTKYNPEQFEIMGSNRYNLKPDGGAFHINGKQKYTRIVIRRKK